MSDNVFDRTGETQQHQSVVEYNQLQDGQQKLLAILPIFSSLLSIFGSFIIILMAFKTRKEKPWTPYHGLLVAMSSFDILASLTSATGSFLYPSETSDRIWAFGTLGTCTTIGFFQQLASSSAMLYNGMLSIYFLLTARFGIPNHEIASRYEARMHYICLGYPLITAFVGLFLDAYGERSTTIGCWVSVCEIDISTGEPVCEERGIVEGFFGSYLVIVTLGMLIFGNLLIWIHLRKQMNIRKQQKIAAGIDLDEESVDDEESTDNDGSSSTLCTTRGTKNYRYRTAGQRRALRLVSSQAFLYVGSFLLCNTVTFILRYIIPGTLNKSDPRQSYIGEMEIPYNFFGLMVIQAILFPLHGLLNVMIYIRPKYMNNRLYHCEETRVWAIRRAIFGDEVKPTIDDDVDRTSAFSVNSIGSPQMLAGQVLRKEKAQEEEQEQEEEKDAEQPPTLKSAITGDSMEYKQSDIEKYKARCEKSGVNFEIKVLGKGASERSFRRETALDLRSKSAQEIATDR